MSNIATLRFASIEEACVVQTLLASGGVPCHVCDYFTHSNKNSAFTKFAGDVRVIFPAAFVDEAKSILIEARHQADPISPDETLSRNRHPLLAAAAHTGGPLLLGPILVAEIYTLIKARREGRAVETAVRASFFWLIVCMLAVLYIELTYIRSDASYAPRAAEEECYAFQQPDGDIVWAGDCRNFSAARFVRADQAKILLGK